MPFSSRRVRGLQGRFPDLRSMTEKRVRARHQPPPPGAMPSDCSALPIAAGDDDDQRAAHWRRSTVPAARERQPIRTWYHGRSPWWSFTRPTWFRLHYRQDFLRGGVSSSGRPFVLMPHPQFDADHSQHFLRRIRRPASVDPVSAPIDRRCIEAAAANRFALPDLFRDRAFSTHQARHLAPPAGDHPLSV